MDKSIKADGVWWYMLTPKGQSRQAEELRLMMGKAQPSVLYERLQ